MNNTYIPNPKSMAQRLVVHTSGMRIIFMSTSGDVDRFSERIHNTIRTAASRKSPITHGSPQPMVGPSETASSPATSQPDMSSAPMVLMRPGVRMGDSGTNRMVMTVATTHRISGAQ